MNLALAGASLAVAAGAVVAVSAREARAALIGLAVVLGLGPFIAEPLPSPAVLGARVVSGILVAYLLRAVVAAGAIEPRRGRAVPEAGDATAALGSRLGWPSEAVLAIGAGIAGIAIATTIAGLVPGGEGEGPAGLDILNPAAVALGAGLASIVVSLAPAFVAGSSLRATIGLLVLAQGLVLGRTGLAGAPGELEQLGIDGLLLALGAGGALLVTLERRGLIDRAETGEDEGSIGVDGGAGTPTRRAAAEPRTTS